MRHSIKRLIKAISDHLKDAKMDCHYAKEEKKEGHSKLETAYISQAKDRMKMANSMLSELATILRDYESEHKRDEKHAEVIDDIMEGWECTFDYLKEEISEMTKKINEM